MPGLTLTIIGFVLLFLGAELLVKGASAAAKYLKVSDFVIGLTVVAFGTSFPELFVNITASIKGDTDIAVGNIIGSNIFNILVILGIAGIIRPLVISKGTVWKEIPFTLLAVVLVAIMGNDIFFDKSSASAITRIDGIILLMFFFVYFAYIFEILPAAPAETPGKKPAGLFKSLLLIFAGLGVLVAASYWTVEGAKKIATFLGASESVIGLTVVACGTSLPELATSIVAAWRKNAEIAVGNIVGSNIFNVFFILGASSVIRPMPFAQTNNFAVIIAIITAAVLFVAMFTGKKHRLDRWEAALFLVLYAIYMFVLVKTA